MKSKDRQWVSQQRNHGFESFGFRHRNVSDSTNLVTNNGQALAFLSSCQKTVAATDCGNT